MLLGELMNEVVDREAPDADVAVSGASRKSLLSRIQRQTFDGRVMSLKGVTQLILA